MLLSQLEFMVSVVLGTHSWLHHGVHGLDKEYGEDYIIGDEGAAYDESKFDDYIESSTQTPRTSNTSKKKPKLVTVKVYVNPDLWSAVDSLIGNKGTEEKVKQYIIGQFQKMTAIADNHMINLDDGGYKVKFDKSIHKLEKSDVKMGKEYVDRLDNNATKQWNEHDIMSQTFTFQQAVEKLPNRNDVDLRIMLLPQKILDSEIKAAAEEHCLCDPEWFGCVLVMGIKDIGNFALSGQLFTHEFGHTLGAELHDDEFYPEDMADSLLMWSAVNPEADTWSEEARKAIKKHNKDCLKRN